MGSGADVVILDLEDAVASADKQGAREATAKWLAEQGRACVRVNGWDSPDFDRDFEALSGLSGLLAIMLPKADSASANAVVARCGVPVIALVESAAGVASAASVAAIPGVVRLAFGHLDYALDIGARPIRVAMLHARSTLVQASRLAGLSGPIDGVTTALDDVDILVDDIRHAQEVGMGGKLLVHPQQVPHTRAAFLPDADTVGWARRVLDAAATGAAVRVDGQMVDAPVVARATAILRQVD